MSAPADAALVDRRRDEYVSDVAAYRHEFRNWLRDLDWADEWRTATFDNVEDTVARDADVLSRLYAAGWSRYGWPEEAGGLGGSEIHRAIYYEELAHAMVPVPDQHWAMETLAPALYHFAPGLAAEYLPAYLSGAEWWGQCFSEPESGSDLAGLRTRAVDDGAGGLVVNGQKIWTSGGPTAARLLVLVRTGTVESRHRGLTMVMIDAEAAGVTVRPIALASGRRELAEIFFDDVRVPPERVVGDVGGGWGVAMYLMQYERGMYGYAVLTTALTELGHLREAMVSNGASSASRERFGRMYVSVVAAQARAATTVRKLAAGTSVGPNSSVDKLLFAKVEKELNDLILDVRREWMMTGAGTDSREELDTSRAKWWYTRAATIMGGTAEVQRGIIADHILGLPKEKR